MLAQVGRSGLVRDLAARLIAEFAKNLDRKLSGDTGATAPSAELNGILLVFGLLRERAARMLHRIFGRGDTSS